MWVVYCTDGWAVFCPCGLFCLFVCFNRPYVQPTGRLTWWADAHLHQLQFWKGVIFITTCLMDRSFVFDWVGLDGPIREISSLEISVFSQTYWRSDLAFKYRFSHRNSVGGSSLITPVWVSAEELICSHLRSTFMFSYIENRLYNKIPPHITRVLMNVTVQDK